MQPLHMTLSIPLVALAFAACASTPGAQPQDMSAAQHEAMGTQAELGATTHLTQYDPKAERGEQRCEGDNACWTDVVNPSEAHKKQAAEYQKAAADHRAASSALRDAEARACVGIADADRDVSPFAHRADIARVDTITGAVGPKGNGTRTEGATVYFRAVPGMTVQWLQRVVDCHLARNAVMGHDAPEMASCPLATKGAQAAVSAAGGGFAVSIRSSDPAGAVEIQRRANALVMN